jgi:hypothetical protein
MTKDLLHTLLSSKKRQESIQAIIEMSKADLSDFQMLVRSQERGPELLAHKEHLQKRINELRKELDELESVLKAKIAAGKIPKEVLAKYQEWKSKRNEVKDLRTERDRLNKECSADQERIRGIDLLVAVGELPSESGHATEQFQSSATSFVWQSARGRGEPEYEYYESSTASYQYETYYTSTGGGLATESESKTESWSKSGSDKRSGSSASGWSRKSSGKAINESSRESTQTEVCDAGQFSRKSSQAPLSENAMSGKAPSQARLSESGGGSKGASQAELSQGAFSGNGRSPLKASEIRLSDSDEEKADIEDLPEEEEIPEGVAILGEDKVEVVKESDESYNNEEEEEEKSITEEEEEEIVPVVPPVEVRSQVCQTDETLETILAAIELRVQEEAQKLENKEEKLAGDRRKVAAVESEITGIHRQIDSYKQALNRTIMKLRKTGIICRSSVAPIPVIYCDNEAMCDPVEPLEDLKARIAQNSAIAAQATGLTEKKRELEATLSRTRAQIKIGRAHV